MLPKQLTHVCSLSAPITCGVDGIMLCRGCTDKAGFAPFGKIATATGLQVARSIFNPTPCCKAIGCDPNKNCSYGVNQGTYAARGNAWIRNAYPGINFIIGAAVTSSG